MFDNEFEEEEELTEEEIKERRELWDRAEDLVDELYSVLCAIEAPDGFLDDLDRIQQWINL